MQPEQPKLKVISAPDALVHDDVALQGKARFRYVGRAQHRAIEFKGNTPPLVEMFPPEEREYPDDNNHRYILRALQKGDLLACDHYTARRAGVCIRKAGE